MSVQTLYTAATGMESLQTKLDVIANNLANVNTTGFKRGRANFEDLFYRQEKLPGSQDQQQNLTATGTAIGLGSRVSSVQTNFNQGAFQETGGQLDVAIEGQGFLRVQDPSGITVYSRAGNLSINAQGQLVMGSAQTGRLIDPNVSFPQDTMAISITADGRVLVRQFGQQDLQQIAQIQLATFPNPEGLLKLGENLYSQTDASGQEIVDNPGNQGIGVLRQGMLEASNVEPVQELIDLITTQRSFELNSQAIQAGDQILQLISNLRR
ncbi:flagellar basal-body rod protein FlgG [Pirellula staleyi DSM 6068]|uniref:Flagellar basal-body rod protein FlgG n=1 Tax=Pirellula staleyi (strain ATCC 27377 / DSM 6068 / ICPB 4128) TaxID=530564 RepID=D2R3S8_PIRSD|nr:flagellar basal-body rod protein FlgG [Pirellula staleyi]ADB17032.1 flagellar basal-body rod protein FlgG [Pirellula staleyi DSM 6068]